MRIGSGFSVEGRWSWQVVRILNAETSERLTFSVVDDRMAVLTVEFLSLYEVLAKGDIYKKLRDSHLMDIFSAADIVLKQVLSEDHLEIDFPLRYRDYSRQYIHHGSFTQRLALRCPDFR